MKIVKILTVAVIISSPAIAGALEVGFPEVSGYSPGESAGPAEWIRYIYLLSMGLVGLALIYTFARAGIEWMAGGANQGMIESAKKRMKGGIIGLLILLGSYLFLKEINPQLVAIRNPQIETGDVDEGLFGFITSLFRPSTETPIVEDGVAVPECTKENPCPSGQRCFDGINGQLVTNLDVPHRGGCSSKKMAGEDCNPEAFPSECYGDGAVCDGSTRKCAASVVMPPTLR